jgi:hypothetical protein
LHMMDLMNFTAGGGSRGVGARGHVCPPCLLSLLGACKWGTGTDINVEV